MVIIFAQWEEITEVESLGVDLTINFSRMRVCCMIDFDLKYSWFRVFSISFVTDLVRHIYLT